MTTASTTQTRRDTLNLRIPPAERNLIDRAAELAGKTRTAFILEAARRAAEEAPLDQDCVLEVEVKSLRAARARSTGIEFGS